MIASDVNAWNYRGFHHMQENTAKISLNWCSDLRLCGQQNARLLFYIYLSVYLSFLGFYIKVHVLVFRIGLKAAKAIECYELLKVDSKALEILYSH